MDVKLEAMRERGLDPEQRYDVWYHHPAHEWRPMNPYRENLRADVAYGLARLLEALGNSVDLRTSRRPR